MREVAPRPLFSQDTGIPNGMPGIQDHTAFIAGGERSREAEHQAFDFPMPENDPRTELLQDFQAKLNRWFDVFKPALASVDSKTEETELGTHVYSGFVINLELTRRGYKLAKTQEDDAANIISNQEYRIPFDARAGDTEYPDNPMIFTEAATVHRNARPSTVRERGFYIEIYSEEEDWVSFRDPYNNHSISQLRAGIVERPQPQIGHYIPYEFFVDVNYIDDVVYPEFDPRRGYVTERAAFFEADVPILGTTPPAVRKEIHVDRGEDKGSLIVRGSDEEKFTLLTGDIDEHARVLLNLADSLIPHVQPQLPEPAAPREQ